MANKVIGNPTATTINIDGLKEQVNGLSEEVDKLKENSGGTNNDVDLKDYYKKDEIDSKLTDKEDKTNKVSSIPLDEWCNGEFWWQGITRGLEEYPNLYMVSNGFILMQLNHIDPLNLQMERMSKDVSDIKEFNKGMIVDDYVDFSSQNRSNPVSGKAVFPIYYDVETMKYQIMELEPIVKQANITRAYNKYEEMIDFYDQMYNPLFLDETSAGAASMGYYTPIGSSMLFKTKDVPDLWVMDRIIANTENTDNPPTPFCADIKADAQAAGMTLDEYIVHKINTEGEFSIKWLKFAPKETDKVELVDYPKREEVVLTPTHAKTGQTIVVKEVDENGKPTKWEAADMGTGGGTTENWELIASGETTEEVNILDITTDNNGNPFELDKMYAFARIPKPATTITPYLYLSQGVTSSVLGNVNYNATILVLSDKRYPHVKVEQYQYYDTFKSSGIYRTWKDKSINQFKIHLWDTGVFPIGTTYEIWGKRVQ